MRIHHVDIRVYLWETSIDSHHYYSKANMSSTDADIIIKEEIAETLMLITSTFVLWFSVTTNRGSLIYSVIYITLLYISLRVAWDALCLLIKHKSIIITLFNMHVLESDEQYTTKITHEILKLKLGRDHRLDDVSIGYLTFKSMHGSRNERTVVHQMYNFVKYFGDHKMIHIGADTQSIMKEEANFFEEYSKDILDDKTIVVYFTPMYLDILWTYYIYTGDKRFKDRIRDVANVKWYYCIFRSVWLQKITANWSLRSIEDMESGAFSTDQIIEYHKLIMMRERELNNGRSFDEVNSTSVEQHK